MAAPPRQSRAGTAAHVLSMNEIKSGHGMSFTATTETPKGQLTGKGGFQKEYQNYGGSKVVAVEHSRSRYWHR